MEIQIYRRDAISFTSIVFKLKNQLYIAGHRPTAFDYDFNDDERRLICTICTRRMIRDDSNPDIWKKSKLVECTCCDKFWYLLTTIIMHFTFKNQYFDIRISYLIFPNMQYNS